MSYPKYFPKGCPPGSARPENIKVYRAVNNNPPKKTDFLPYALKFSHLVKKQITCREAAASVNGELEDLIAKWKALPGLARSYKFIAEGYIVRESGVILDAPCGNDKSHINWWIKETYDPSSFFKVME